METPSLFKNDEEQLVGQNSSAMNFETAKKVNDGDELDNTNLVQAYKTIEKPIPVEEGLLI